MTGMSLMRRDTIFSSMSVPPLLLVDGIKAAVIHARAALDALGLVDDVGRAHAPEMAPVGQPWAQRVQPLHLVGSTMYWMSALHTPAGQRFS